MKNLTPEIVKRQPFKLTEITCSQRSESDFELQLIKAIRYDLSCASYFSVLKLRIEY